jgi:hypothetical protein
MKWFVLYQFISGDFEGVGERAKRAGESSPQRSQSSQRNLVGAGALEEFSEWVAERKDLPKIFGREIRAGGLWIGAFAADLYDADNAVAGKNRRTNDFLNEFAAFRCQFYAFEHTGVFHRGEIIDNFGAAFSRGAGGEGRFAGERNESDIFQRLRNNEIQMTPAIRNAEDSYFVGADGKVLRDTCGDGGERNLRGRAAFYSQSFRQTFQFRYEIHFSVQKLSSCLLKPGTGLGEKDARRIASLPESLI